MLAAERYDGAEPVNLGTGVETSIRELAETIADADRVHRRDRLGHVDAERAAAPAARRLAGARRSSASARTPRCATASHARSAGTARTASRMRIPDFPRRALARFGHLAVRPVPLLLTLAVVELATVAWLAFDTPHNGWVWHSGGDATEYWTARVGGRARFRPAGGDLLRPAGLLRLGAARHRHHAPPRPAGRSCRCRRCCSFRSCSSSSGRSPISSTAVSTPRSRRRSGRSGRS